MREPGRRRPDLATLEDDEGEGWSSWARSQTVTGPWRAKRNVEDPEGVGLGVMLPQERKQVEVGLSLHSVDSPNAMG